ncbi:MAG: DUF4157 domain-containing protein [Leptolyngbya sp. SIO4C5]|nr:DUF4157 domain-containing protein [Leptolyngbya sp. SIO4C5]
MERAKAQPNLLEILIRNSQATQTTESQAPVQSNTIQAKSDTTGDRPESSVEQPLHKTGLPGVLKAGIENLSGYSLDDVRVHYNSLKPVQLQALAYTQGSEIHVAPGQEQHLPHEAWHVVQQAQGRVRPTTQLKGVGVNDDTGLEQEADVMGKRSLQMRHSRQLKANAMPTNHAVGERYSAFVDYHCEEVAQPKLLHEARSKPTAAQNLKLAPSAASYFAPVIQREIWIGDTSHKSYNEQLIDSIYNLAKPYITQWVKMDEIFWQKTNRATKTAKNNYLDQDGEDVKGLKNDVRAMLRKYNAKTFDNNQDLARQVVQDVKLRLLGMENVIGVDHQDGQFSATADDPNVGRTGKTKTLRIYRTMSAANWNNYTQSNDLGDILYGHGGSLGQAMHYFAMSKRDKKDDVLVEFKFSNTAQNLMDSTQISRGGEGGAPRNNKLTGKSEQNDIMQLDQSIFSVNLSRSKALIKQLNPQVELIAHAT